MTYAVKQDMIDRFNSNELIQITNPEDPAAVAINDTKVNRALADADGEIDGHLQGRYALPLNPVPTIIIGYACDIARYRLYDDRATEHVRKRYEDAVKFLQMVGQGKISLGLDANNVAAPSAGGPAHDAADRVFTRDSLADY